MKIVDIFSISSHWSMFHEYSYRQRSRLSESRLHPPRSVRPGQHRGPFLLSHHTRPTPPNRCTRCGRTFSSTIGTPYYRLHKPRALFDEVARMSVDGVGKSAIARIKQIAWNTAARWLELAAAFARRFSDRVLRRVYLHELQADEIRSFLLHKQYGGLDTHCDRGLVPLVALGRGGSSHSTQHPSNPA